MQGNCKDCKLCRINRVLVLNSQPSTRSLPKPVTHKHQQQEQEPPSSSSSKPLKPKMYVLGEATVWPSDRPIRLLSICTWIPAFSFLLPFGIITEGVLPALGLLPMTLGAGLGALHILGKARYRAVNVAADVFLACFMISILIPSWVALAQSSCYYWRYCHDEPGMTMLASYGTMMMMVNFCIHVWFVVREIPFKRMFIKQEVVCPHCHCNMRGRVETRRTGSPNSHESWSSLEHGVHTPASSSSALTLMEEGNDKPTLEKREPSFEDDCRDESQPLM